LIYTINYLCVIEKVTTYNIAVYLLGLALFTVWFVWEGKRAGFLKILIGKTS
jgi:hypothetical protein